MGDGHRVAHHPPTPRRHPPINTPHPGTPSLPRPLDPGPPRLTPSTPASPPPSALSWIPRVVGRFGRSRAIPLRVVCGAHDTITPGAATSAHPPLALRNVRRPQRHHAGCAGYLSVPAVRRGALPPAVSRSALLDAHWLDPPAVQPGCARSTPEWSASSMPGEYAAGQTAH